MRNNYFIFTDSNSGSVNQLVSNEVPLAILPLVADKLKSTYMSQQSLKQSPVYSNIQNVQPTSQVITKQKSYSTNELNIDDLHLDPVIIREHHIIPNLTDLKRKSETETKKETASNELTFPEKDGTLLSASRLRLLQDTTMIESALDLDSLDDSSIGTNSQAGLMKIGVV